MKAKYILILVVYCGNILYSQNWSVFNKNYRYNYRYDNSSIVTNVLFADTFLLTGGDTILKLNRVVAKCTGSYCPTSTVVLSGNDNYIINMPQFLQKEIIIKPNYIRLNDTIKLNIFPTCTLGAVWKFDSLNNVNITCINIIQQTNFGVSDSVKILLVNTSDTLKLSKNFGILQWPQLYSQNKYYKLTGVELASTYSPTAMFGERVPNAWDFYDYNIGDEFTIHNQMYQGSSIGSCRLTSYTITNKTIVGDSYIYNANTATRKDTGTYTQYYTCIGMFPPPITYSTSIITYSNLSHRKLKENISYPGQFIYDNKFINYALTNGFYYSIVQFYNDNLNNFYKLHGQTCVLNASTSPQFTNTVISSFGGAPYPSSNNIISNNWGIFHEYFTTGFGRVSKKNTTFGGEDKSCLLHYKKGNTVYFGPNPLITNLNEFKYSYEGFNIYPNPANSIINIEFLVFNNEPYKIEILNTLGQVLQTTTITYKTTAINIQHLPAGIYFLTVKIGNTTSIHKLIKN